MLTVFYMYFGAVKYFWPTCCGGLIWQRSVCGSAPHLHQAKVNEKCGASRVVLEVTRCKGWVVCLVTSVCHNKHAFRNEAYNAHRDVGYSNK
jgi:hypothetical protein